MFRELQFAIRRVRRDPLPALATILIVAFGIGVATPLFCITDALLFKPLPFRDPQRLIAMSAPFAFDRRLTAAERIDVRQRLDGSGLLDQSALTAPGLLFDTSATDVADLGLVQFDVSPNFFQMLGVRLAHGRWPDASADADIPSVLISESLWRSRLGADAAVLGSVVEMAGKRVRIAGVLGAQVTFPSGANVWAFRDRWPASALPSYARLTREATIEQMRAQFPRLTVAYLRDAVTPAGAASVAYLLATTSLVLVIAWVQVAALQMSRVAGRARDIGVRLALGGTRRRVLQPFLADGLLIGAAALVLGWLATPAATALIVRQLPADMTRGQWIAADWRAFAFAAAASAVGVLFFTLLPLRLIAAHAPLSTLRGHGSAHIRLSAGRSRAAMLAVQLAVTCALLYITGLAVHSVLTVSRVNLGFTPANVVGVTLPAGAFRPTTPADLDGLIAAMRAVPGVEAAAAAYTYPGQRGAMRGTARLAEHPAVEPFSVRVNYVTATYFSTLRIAVEHGRLFGDDRGAGDPDVLVNAEFLRQSGRDFRFLEGQRVQVTSLRGRIVGVVADVLDEEPDRPRDPQIYFPAARGPVRMLLARTVGAHTDSVTSLQAFVRARSSGRPPRRTVLLADEVKRGTSEYRGRGWLLAALGAAGIVLAFIGLAGGLMYSVQQRRREIAIHLALGASPSRIRRRVFRDAALTGAVGLLAGLAGGVMLGHWAAALWYGVDPVDPSTIAGVALLIGATVAGGAILPALYASTVEPAIALREE